MLYVEDTLANIRLIEAILHARPQVELLPAMQGQLGLDLAREHRPDMILLDIHLPDLDGDEVLARLQADPATREIPAVVLSADATEKQRARLLERGRRGLPHQADRRRAAARDVRPAPRRRQNPVLTG